MTKSIDKIIAFLKDRNSRELHVINGTGISIYVKVKSSPTSDIILENWTHEGVQLGARDKFAGQGIIHYPSLTIIEPGGRLLIPEDIAVVERQGLTVKRIQELFTEYISSYAQKLNKLIEKEGLYQSLPPYADNKEEVSGTYMDAYEYAMDLYMRNGDQAPLPTWDGLWRLNGGFNVCEYLDNKDTLVQAHAEQYFIKDREYIEGVVRHIITVNSILDNLNNNYGDHTACRDMANSIANQKTVWVDIVKDGIALSVRYDAEMLKYRLRDFSIGYAYLREWHMDAPSRAKVQKLFGKLSVIRATDIVAIRHGRKTLWSR